jgi:hypothetical protein
VDNTPNLQTSSSRLITTFYEHFQLAMVKKIFLLLGSALYAGTAMAQYCATDEFSREYTAKHPEISVLNAKLEADIQAQLKNIDLSKVAMKGTNTDTAVINIPVVVHIVHDYGLEYVSDDAVYTMIKELNELYNKQNASLSGIIPPFVPYIGNGYIKFHLATKDPQGNPTHGITRKRNYLTRGGDDQAKYDLWNPSAYLNIWFINHIGLGSSGAGIVAAYSMLPANAQYVPYYDGLISNYQFINNTSTLNYTVGHEIGHYLNLNHPWGSNNSPGVACGDDGVLDTPPTKGHFSTCNLYDTECAIGNPNGPDTTNVQNVMDYSSCAVMFTQGQMDRVRATLRSTIASRSSLWSPANLAATGALLPRPDMAPVADFSVNRVFFCQNPGAFGLTFSNRSWNDTVTSLEWRFSNNAVVPTSTSTSVTNGFTQSGWVTVTLTATSAHGTNTISKQAAYIADPANIPGGTTEDFIAGSNTVGQFPAFDYYNTGRKWEITNTAGMYDNTSMRYINKDTRTSANNEDKTGTPAGDYSDFFTPAYDLTGSQFSNNCFVNFVSSGASRNSLQNDVLELSYSIDCGLTWRAFDSLSGNALANKGVITTDYTPSNASDWKFNALNVPTAARTAGRTFFRFRYKPGVTRNGVGTGNNYYLDRLSISNSSTNVNSVALETTGIEVAPNPTSGDAFVLLKGAGNGVADLIVSDITGKTVYKAQQKISGNLSRIDIPSSSLMAKGVYMIRVIADTKTYTRKLVVN